MKQIQPVSIWYNGQMVQATIFNMTSISDNLSTEAIFYYQLLSSTNQQLAIGNLTMTSFDYEAYSTSPDSNAYAYQWGATQLNLTLV
jgi:hypothetical protein